MKKFKKFIILGIIVLVLLGLYAFDFARAQDTQIELVSITPKTVVADPNQPVLITLKVSKHGRLAAGDNVTALVKGGGNLSGDKIKVQDDGTVTFKYFPYSYIPGVFEESDVDIEFRNISDSVFIAVQKKKVITLEIKKPSSSGSGGMSMEDLFAD